MTTSVPCNRMITCYSPSSSNLLRSRCTTSSSFHFCHSLLSLAILLSNTYFPSIRSLSRCILFLPLVAYPLILPLITEIKMILQMMEVGEGVLSVREHPIMPNVRMLNEGPEC